MEELTQELEKWSEKYDFNFQIRGKDKNTCYIEKDGIPLADYGGCVSVREIFEWALDKVYTMNRVPMEKRICTFNPA